MAGNVMNISDLISPDRVILGMRARDKQHLLQELSRLSATAVGIDPDVILRALQTREELGSTGMGRGFALPHARIDGVKDLFGMFVRLSRPLAFHAIDGKPVDLVFFLLIPAGRDSEHVAALAAISRRLRDPDTVQQLRKAESAKTAYQLLTNA